MSHSHELYRAAGVPSDLPVLLLPLPSLLFAHVTAARSGGGFMSSLKKMITPASSSAPAPPTPEEGEFRTAGCSSHECVISLIEGMLFTRPSRESGVFVHRTLLDGLSFRQLEIWQGWILAYGGSERCGVYLRVE